MSALPLHDSDRNYAFTHYSFPKPNCCIIFCQSHPPIFSNPHSCIIRAPKPGLIPLSYFLASVFFPFGFPFSREDLCDWLTRNFCWMSCCVSPFGHLAPRTSFAAGWLPSCYPLFLPFQFPLLLSIIILFWWLPLLCAFFFFHTWSFCGISIFLFRHF